MDEDRIARRVCTLHERISTVTPRDCVCEKCVEACHRHPGWFLPGEAEKVAEFLGMEFTEFEKRFLIKDHASNQAASDAPYVYSPRKPEVDKPDETIRSAWRQGCHGDCVFLKEDRCSIHPVKPFECRKVFACDNNDRFIRDQIETKWIEVGAPLGMRPEYGDD